MNYWDNSNRFSKIYYRFQPYVFFALNRLKKGIPLPSILRTQFPFILRDSHIPPSIILEFSSFCNIKCKYCNNHYKKRPKGYLGESVLENILLQYRNKKMQILTIGGGEPTLHPKFEEFSYKLAKTAKYFTITTNGQWTDDKIADAILTSPYSQVDISMDAGGKNIYEYSREQASYERLIRNIEYLVERKKEYKSETLIVLRLMIRPSQMKEYKSELKKWRIKVDLVFTSINY